MGLKTVATFGFLALTVTPAQEPAFRVAHVFVALCDNQYQGIVPVPARLGDGDDPKNNLYWGALGGVNQVFSHSARWRKLASVAPPSPAVLERCVFRHADSATFVVADAYRGREIRQALEHFFQAAAGQRLGQCAVIDQGTSLMLPTDGGADLTAYLGHNGLMDFSVTVPSARRPGRPVMVLGCMSAAYFSAALKDLEAKPLLLTRQLMYPGAMILEAGLEGWLTGETALQIRERAASAYSRNQKISIAAARGIFSRIGPETGRD